jgi:hypothetical protein
MKNLSLRIHGMNVWKRKFSWVFRDAFRAMEEKQSNVDASDSISQLDLEASSKYFLKFGEFSGLFYGILMKLYAIELEYCS